MSISTSISIAALLVSVLSPFLTALLKNRHEVKMYKLLFYSEHKSDPVRSTMQELYDMFVASKHVSDRSMAPELFDSICLMLTEQYPRIQS